VSRFVAIDVETANASFASICQIGIVQFENGREVSSRSWLVDPDDWFDPLNISIHGIDEQKVAGAPRYQQINRDLCELLDGSVAVCHSHFDRSAIAQAAARNAVSPPKCVWLDSARVARRTWTQFSQRGYGLADLAVHCEIDFQHHDALEDARTAGLILVSAMTESGIGLDEWIVRSTKPISATSGQIPIRRSGDGDGALVGEVIVFTGALTLPRREAADKAAEAGGDVHPGVTKETTLLVVGDQDIARLGGKEKSSKHIKAEQLIGKGQQLRIVGETDFLALSAITS
jgi:DNA polymerase III subunit epsilon